MILRNSGRLKFWQIYAVCLTGDVAIRLLRRFSDIKLLVAEPAGGWTLSDMLPVLVWMGFEAAWAFVLAFVITAILNSYFARSEDALDRDNISGEYLNRGEENSTMR